MGFLKEIEKGMYLHCSVGFVKLCKVAAEGQVHISVSESSFIFTEVRCMKPWAGPPTRKPLKLIPWGALKQAATSVHW